MPEEISIQGSNLSTFAQIWLSSWLTVRVRLHSLSGVICGNPIPNEALKCMVAGLNLSKTFVSSQERKVRHGKRTHHVDVRRTPVVGHRPLVIRFSELRAGIEKIDEQSREIRRDNSAPEYRPTRGVRKAIHERSALAL